MGHHVLRDDGHRHAGPGHQRDQRRAPAYAGLAVGRQRGTAMAVWGVGIMMAPILGPTVGGWIVDNWSWRWIFYINIPIGFLGFLMVSAFLFDSPFAKKSRGIDAVGLVLMVVGFGCL